MRCGKLYATYLSLKLKTILYSSEELNKDLIYCSDLRYIDKLNSFFENDNLNFRIKPHKKNLYKLEII